MTILLTGSTGLIGNVFLEHLRRIDLKIKVIIITRNKDITCKSENGSDFEDLVLEYYSIEELEDIKGYVIDIFINLAGFSSSKDDDETMMKLIDANIILPAKLINSVCQKNSLKNFVNFGSFSEYSENLILSPSYLYSATKSAAKSLIDYYSKKFGFNVLNLILYSVYGAKGSTKRFYDYLIESSSSEIAIDVGSGNNCLDWVHVEDVSEWLIKLVSGDIDLNRIQDRYCDLFLGTGEATSLFNFSKALEKNLNMRFNLNWGARPDRDSELKLVQAPIERNPAFLKWNPRKFKDVYE